ncbi:hypothetical protein BMS3Abin03_03002 [bacterium BMS3Abin03]|nr:hypothetical protein BMS3Abin03_03002 [bacterium BMS3Abin03]
MHLTTFQLIPIYPELNPFSMAYKLGILSTKVIAATQKVQLGKLIFNKMKGLKMKLFILFISVLGILFFVSCSDLNQNSSPVSPDANKVSFSQGPILGDPFYYSYLQEFEEEQVATFGGSKSNGIVITLEDSKAPDEIIHAFVVLDYFSPTISGQSYLVFVGKLSSSTFEIPGYTTEKLANVRVYALTSYNGSPKSKVYDQYQPFQDMLINNFGITGQNMKIISSSWNESLLDAFLEVSIGGSRKLIYIERPASGSFSVPITYPTPGSNAGVRLFGRFQ